MKRDHLEELQERRRAMMRKRLCYTIAIMLVLLVARCLDLKTFLTPKNQVIPSASLQSVEFSNQIALALTTWPCRASPRPKIQHLPSVPSQSDEFSIQIALEPTVAWPFKMTSRPKNQVLLADSVQFVKVATQIASVVTVARRRRQVRPPRPLATECQGEWKSWRCRRGRPPRVRSYRWHGRRTNQRTHSRRRRKHTNWQRKHTRWKWKQRKRCRWKSARCRRKRWWWRRKRRRWRQRGGSKLCWWIGGSGMMWSKWQGFGWKRRRWRREGGSKLWWIDGSGRGGGGKWRWRGGSLYPKS